MYAPVGGYLGTLTDRQPNFTSQSVTLGWKHRHEWFEKDAYVFGVKENVYIQTSKF